MKHKLFFSSLLHGGILALTASVAPAQLQLTTPIEANGDPVINGTGAPPNGWVELHADRVSLGSVQADGDGEFTFEGLDIVEGQSLVVTAARVWNFDTDGDTEGWFSQNPDRATVDAVDGSLVINKLTNESADIRLPLGLSLDPAIYRVWEFRINNPTSLAGFNFRYRGTNAFDATNVVGNMGMKQNMAPGVFETVKLNPDYNFSNDELTTYQTQEGGLIQSIRLDFDHPVGEIIRIDTIRVTESFTYNFDRNGDSEYLDFNNARGVPMIADGVASWTLTASNPNIVKTPTAPDKTRIDPSYFTHVAVGGSMVHKGEATTDQWTLFVNPAGAGFPGNFVPINPLPADGSYFSERRRIADEVPSYATSPPMVAWRLDPGQFNMEEGDEVIIDFWRFEPETPFGPSEPATVYGPTSAADWLHY